MRPIVLSGFMGTGKSTVGPRLAAKLGIPFLDTDAEIERITGQRVPDIWRAEGEPAFRARETELVKTLLSDPAPRVISFGGGTVTTPSARRFAIDHALVVTLTAAAETIVGRAKNIADRPNLGVGGDPVARARELLAQRAEAYAECHLTIATDQLDVEAAVDAIATLGERDPLLVPLGSRSYTIDVCVDAPSRLTDAVARCAPSSLVVVSDSNVQRARGAAIDAALRPLAVKATRVTLAPGEAQKNLASVEVI
jgi:shikimate kinase/3-dehydroquinate synthase